MIRGAPADSVDDKPVETTNQVVKVEGSALIWSSELPMSFVVRYEMLQVQNASYLRWQALTGEMVVSYNEAPKAKLSERLHASP